jgi:microcystin-dependent protein
MDPILGEIRMVGFNFAPVGWALCNGQLLSIPQNTALFSLLGTFYGGDGRTTFGLPNFQGRVPIDMGTGSGLSPRSIGQTGGGETTTLTIANLPAHSHNVVAQSTAPASSVPSGAFLASGTKTAPVEIYTTSTGGNVAMNIGMIQSAGGGQPVAAMPPYLCINFIIALQGVYPARS